MSFQYRKTKQQQSSAIDAQHKHFPSNNTNNNSSNYFNKENLSALSNQQSLYNCSTNNSNQIYSNTLFNSQLPQPSQSASLALKLQQSIQVQPHYSSQCSNENYSTVTSVSSSSSSNYPNTRRFGKELSNYQATTVSQNQYLTNKVGVSSVSSCSGNSFNQMQNNSSTLSQRGTSKELSANNNSCSTSNSRKQTSYVSQQQQQQHTNHHLLPLQQQYSTRPSSHSNNNNNNNYMNNSSNNSNSYSNNSRYRNSHQQQQQQRQSVIPALHFHHQLQQQQTHSATNTSISKMDLEYSTTSNNTSIFNFISQQSQQHQQQLQQLYATNAENMSILANLSVNTGGISSIQNTAAALASARYNNHSSNLQQGNGLHSMIPTAIPIDSSSSSASSPTKDAESNQGEGITEHPINNNNNYQSILSQTSFYNSNPDSQSNQHQLHQLQQLQLQLSSQQQQINHHHHNMLTSQPTKQQQQQQSKQQSYSSHQSQQQQQQSELQSVVNPSTVAIESIDLRYANKPEYVPQYAKEIFEYLRANEERYICKTAYFEADRQPDLNSRMRTILIDWLIDVHLKFDLLPETLFLTVNLIDRYLEVGPRIEKAKFQLVGIAALFIACKYEEIYPPMVNDFTYVCDNAYTKQELFEFEGRILSALNFNITTPSAYRFLERYARIAEFDQKCFLTALYFLEMTLVDYAGIKCTPSQAACAAIMLTSIIHRRKERWSEAMVRNTKYSQADLVNVVEEVCEMHRKAEAREKQTQDKEKQLNAVKRKYSQPRFECVFQIVFAFFQAAESRNHPIQLDTTC